MDRLGVDTVDRVTLAGAFGSHIDPVYAMVLGMIPDCPLDKVGSAGNAAGTGARIALLNRKARAEIEDVVERIEKVETAIEPRFQEHFVAAMAIPHKTAPYPHLAAAVTTAGSQRKPAAVTTDGDAGRAEGSKPGGQLDEDQLAAILSDRLMRQHGCDHRGRTTGIRAKSRLVERKCGIGRVRQAHTDQREDRRLR